MPSRRRPRATASATLRSSSATSTRTRFRVVSAGAARYAPVTARLPSVAAMSESAIHEEPREALESALFEIKRVIIGQDAMLERVMVALLSGGHVLLEGVPGLAKTLTIKTLASVVGGSFSRIQFTPDLVPSDLVGTRIYRPGQRQPRHRARTGVRELPAGRRDQPRAREGAVGAARGDAGAAGHDRRDQTHPVPLPFLVLATQNPIESEGTYPLPEAQVDRFLMKILVDYPAPGDEAAVVEPLSRPRAAWSRSGSASPTCCASAPPPPT